MSKKQKTKAAPESSGAAFVFLLSAFSYQPSAFSKVDALLRL